LFGKHVRGKHCHQAARELKRLERTKSPIHAAGRALRAIAKCARHMGNKHLAHKFEKAARKLKKHKKSVRKLVKKGKKKGKHVKKLSKKSLKKRKPRKQLKNLRKRQRVLRNLQRN